jgi:serralysin
LAVLPVRICASAFAAGIPARDLLLSPDHAVFVEDERGGVLIPVGNLVNGATIARQQVDGITYFHVELRKHDVLIAEGLKAESYLDTGNRASFESGTDASVPCLGGVRPPAPANGPPMAQIPPASRGRNGGKTTGRGRR